MTYVPPIVSIRIFGNYFEITRSGSQGSENRIRSLTFEFRRVEKLNEEEKSIEAELEELRRENDRLQDEVELAWEEV